MSIQINTFFKNVAGRLLNFFICTKIYYKLLEAPLLIFFRNISFLGLILYTLKITNVLKLNNYFLQSDIALLLYFLLLFFWLSNTIKTIKPIYKKYQLLALKIILSIVIFIISLAALNPVFLQNNHELYQLFNHLNSNIKFLVLMACTLWCATIQNNTKINSTIKKIERPNKLNISKPIIAFYILSLSVFICYNIQGINLNFASNIIDFVWKKLSILAIGTYAFIVYTIYWFINNYKHFSKPKIHYKFKKEHLFLIFILFFSLYVKTMTFKFNFNFTDHFLLPILAHDALQQNILEYWHHIPIGFHWNLVTGQGYFSIAVIPLILVYKIFGITNITTYSTFMALSAFSLIFFFLVLRNFYTKKNSLLITALYSVSGWHVVISTYPRFYSLMELTLLSSLYFLLRIKSGFDNKLNRNLFIISVSILIQTNIQLFPFHLILLALWAFESKIFKGINNILLVLLPIYIRLSTFANGTILHQYIGYHFSSNFYIIFALLIFSIFYFKKKKNSYIIINLFLIGLYLLPPMATILDRDLMERYTHVIFPLFMLLILGFILEQTYKLLTSRPLDPVNTYTTLLFLIVIFSTKGFFLNNHAELNTIWPDNYNTKTETLEKKQSDRVQAFKPAFDILITEQKIEEQQNVCLLDVDAITLEWYTKINEQTRADNIKTFWLANNPDIQNYFMPYKDVKNDLDPHYYHEYTNTPVIENFEMLNKLNETCSNVYIVISKNYQYIIDKETRAQIASHSKLLNDTQKYSIYQLSNNK